MRHEAVGSSEQYQASHFLLQEGEKPARVLGLGESVVIAEEGDVIWRGMVEGPDKLKLTRIENDFLEANHHWLPLADPKSPSSLDRHRFTAGELPPGCKYDNGANKLSFGGNYSGNYKSVITWRQ